MVPPKSHPAPSDPQRALDILEAGIAQNKAQLAKRFLDLARLMTLDEPPGPTEWPLVRASLALTVGILAREDEEVLKLMNQGDNDTEAWLFEVLRRRSPNANAPARRRRRAAGTR